MFKSVDLCSPHKAAQKVSEFLQTHPEKLPGESFLTDFSVLSGGGTWGFVPPLFVVTQTGSVVTQRQLQFYQNETTFPHQKISTEQLFSPPDWLWDKFSETSML